MELDGKVAIVTGAASGLGFATCQQLAAAGARIAAFDLAEDRLEQLRNTISAVPVSTHRVDVADEHSVQKAVNDVATEHGGVHLAVSCAGVADAAKTLSKGEPFPLGAWNKVISINLTGTFNVIRFSALQMAKNEPDQNGERGVIVNTASGAAWQGQMGQAAYSASKAGVMGLTLPVARDLASYGIRVVTIAPGLFETEMVAGLPDKVSQAIIDNMILFPHRMGQPSEFAGLVRHIAENAYFNATTISLDGGARMAAR